MGKITIAITIKDGKFVYEYHNFKTSVEEIGQSVAALELIKNKQMKLFEEITLKKEYKNKKSNIRKKGGKK